MVNITGLRNPYDYANPARADDCFAGRSAELSAIDYVLEQSGTARPVGYLALYGRRAAGKTSLLNMTENLAAERGYLVVRVNLVPANADPARFFATMYEELIGAVAEVCNLASTDGRRITSRMVRRIIEGGPADEDLPLEFPENLAHAAMGGQLSEMALRNDLRRISELVNRPIVLLIDEAQLIADRTDVLSLLRTLGNRLESYVLVLAGTPELVDRIKEVFDFLLRQFSFIKVERFVEVADVIQCMTRPLEAAGLTPEQCFVDRLDVQADDLMRLTDGNPYEIQLFCHVMFSRWQTGAADGMKLTAQAIDDVRATLDVGDQHADRPLIDAVRRMSDQELLALNIWCSSLEHATLDQIRFACRVSDRTPLTSDQLDRYLDQFIRDGLIELINNRVRLIGETVEHIYTRLSAAQRLDPRAPLLVSRIDFRLLLSGELTEVLLQQVLDGNTKPLLRTCCLGMRPELLAQGMRDLAELPTDRPVNHTVEYLHEAILESRVPTALRLTTVECSYDATTATRWICQAATDNLDVNTDPAFLAAQERVAALGGELQAECTTISLRPMPEIVDWLVDTFADRNDRSNMAHRHVSAAFEPYESGDMADAFAHLNAAFRLSPGWRAANNLAYLNLVAGDYPATRDWVHRALPLGLDAQERALSRYNGAIAAALESDWSVALDWLAEAVADLDNQPSLEDEDLQLSHMMIPTFDYDHIVVQEENDTALTDAIARARDVIELAERFERIRGSA